MRSLSSPRAVSMMIGVFALVACRRSRSARKGRPPSRPAHGRPRPAKAACLPSRAPWALARSLGHMFAGRRIIDHLGDVGRMIADTLEVLGHAQQMGRLAN